MKGNIKINFFIYYIIFCLIVSFCIAMYINNITLKSNDKPTNYNNMSFVNIYQEIDYEATLTAKLYEDLPKVETNFTPQDSDLIIDNLDEYKHTVKKNTVFDKALRISQTSSLTQSTAEIIVKYSEKLNLPISLILAVIEHESNFDQFAVGSHQDRGYCQIIPKTEKWLAEKFGHILNIEYNPERIFDPEYNIGLGILYLHVLRKTQGENYHKILSSYNRGTHNLRKYYEKHGTYVTRYSRGVLRKEKKYINVN